MSDHAENPAPKMPAPASPAAVVIRRATRDEAEAIAALIRTAFATVAAEIGRDIPPLHEAAENIAAAFDRGDIVLVAEIGGRIVGSVRGEVLKDGGVMVRQLVVLPDARRNGVARALMCALEEQYPEASRFELFTGEMATGPIALYTSLGYELVEPREDYGFPLVWLEKQR